MTEDERISEIIRVTKETHKFGSIGRHMTPEFLEKIRREILPPKAKVKISQEESNRLLNTPYGLDTDS